MVIPLNGLYQNQVFFMDIIQTVIWITFCILINEADQFSEFTFHFQFPALIENSFYPCLITVYRINSGSSHSDKQAN